MKKVTLVNYGIGNILSVKRALEYHHAKVTITCSPNEIEKAERLIVPGVGTFPGCMNAIIAKDIKESLIRFAYLERPYLGICVGMQMLMETGEEFGKTQGLSLIKGKVTKIESQNSHGQTHKIPFIGWKNLEKNPKSKLLKGIKPTDRFYFVHSFKAMPMKTENLIASYDYGGIKIAAIIQNNNIMGTQFHPEKSGPCGLKIINNFLNL